MKREELLESDGNKKSISLYNKVQIPWPRQPSPPSFAE